MFFSTIQGVYSRRLFSIVWLAILFWLLGTPAALVLSVLSAGAEPASPNGKPSEPPSLTEKEKEEGFTPLFDGKTLKGWTICCLPKDKEFAAKAWTVDQGALLANTMGHRDHFYILLATEREYSDFILRLRFQVPRHVRGNSGVQIRSRYNVQTGWMEGPQVDINPPNPQLTGKLWREGPGPHGWLSNEQIPNVRFFYAEEGPGWNDLEIIANRMHIKTTLNGVTMVDYDGAGVLDDQWHQKVGVGRKGVIALQIHSADELLLRFKDIRIKELR